MNVPVFACITLGVLVFIAIVWFIFLYIDKETNDDFITDKEDEMIDTLLKAYYAKKHCDICKEKRNSKKK